MHARTQTARFCDHSNSAHHVHHQDTQAPRPRPILPALGGDHVLNDVVEDESFIGLHRGESARELKITLPSLKNVPAAATFWVFGGTKRCPEFEECLGLGLAESDGYGSNARLVEECMLGITNES